MTYNQLDGGNKKVISLAIFLLNLCLFTVLKAQTSTPERFQIFAPNTYELGRYGDVPVDISAGIPQINLPVLKFTDKDISLDISLSYHASGIKVDQEATWVGLGWALNAGGVITREIRGLPDDYSRTNAGFGFRTIITTDPAGTPPQSYYDQMRYTLGVAAEGNGTDNGSDVYYYNFNGHAGKFLLDAGSNAFLTKYEDFKVEFDGDFVITDENGLRYEFRETEITRPVISGLEYISAWYLSKITSPAGGEINIEYAVGGLSTRNYQQRCSSQLFLTFHGTRFGSIPPVNPPEGYPEPCLNWHSTIWSKIPKKIRDSSGNYVEFVASGNTENNKRLDSEIMALNRLDNIVLYDYNQTQIRKFNFNYSYFEANNSHKYPVVESGNTRNFLNYRLRLDSFQEIATNGQLGAPYRMEYFGDDNPATNDLYTLPYRLSPSQDHWGYYNNTFNTTIFPGNPASRPFHYSELALAFAGGNYASPGSSFTFEVSGGANREPDAEATKAGSLKKIVYPTGGFTQFDFEPHEIYGNTFLPLSGGLRVKQVKTQDGLGQVTTKNYQYVGSTAATGSCLSIDNPYFTWYYHPYNPDLFEYGWPEKLAGLGVPYNLVANNAHILRVDGTPMLMLGSGANAFYQSVKESSPDNGYTIYEYSNDDDLLEGGSNDIDGVPTPGHFYGAYIHTVDEGPYYPATYFELGSSSCVFPYPNFVNNDWRRGHLLTKTTYSNENVMLTEDSTIYDVRAVKVVPGYKVIKFDDYNFYYSRYYDVAGMAKPVREVGKKYNADGTFVRTVNDLEYTSPYHKQLTQSVNFSSSGETVTTKYYYPTEYGAALSPLKDRHILRPVDVRSYRNGNFVSGQQVMYGINGLPLAFYQADTEGSGSGISFDPQSPYTFRPSLLNSYDGSNNLQIQKLQDGPATSYVWGYNGQYPIAEAKKASPEELYYDGFEDRTTGVSGGARTGEKCLAYPYPDGNIITKVMPAGKEYVISYWTKAPDGLWTYSGELPYINNTHTMSGGPYIDDVRIHPVDAQMTTYTYRPLVGMTSMTDAKGMTTYYEYDGFQRLKSIKDAEGNILKNYEYHYKDQP